MQKFLLLIVLATGLLTESFAQLSQTSGGADDYGYSWVSSDSKIDTTWCTECDSTTITVRDTVYCAGSSCAVFDTTLFSCTSCVSAGDSIVGVNWTYRDTITSILGIDGPAFSWVDITTTGTQIIGYGDDQGPGKMIPIGFDFPFYWYNISEFYVGGNGYICFSSPLDVSANSNGNAFPSMPLNDAGNDYNNWVAPLMCDLNPDPAGGGKIFYETIGTDKLIVSYVDVPFWGSATLDFQGKNTFQVIFSLADTSITFQYLKKEGTYGASYNASRNPLVIGIESKAGQAGLLLSQKEQPSEGLAIKFSVKKASTFSLTDISLDWHKNKTNAAFFGIVGKPTWINLNVSNSGETDITSDIKVTTTVEKYVLGSLASANVFNPSSSNKFVLNSLKASISEEYTYTDAFVPSDSLAGVPSQGTYVITSNTTFLDGVSDNNKIETELVIVDDKLDNMDLNYYNVPDLTKGEQFGTFGFKAGGIYIDLPIYPVTLKEINFYVSTGSGAIPTGGIQIDVYSRDATGAVGDLVYSSFVAKDVLKYPASEGTPMIPTILTGIEDNSGNPVVIDDQGFYVSFKIEDETESANYTLFEDIVRPFSLRSYEVNGLLWGNYRDASVADPMIGVVVDGTNATTGIEASISNELELSNAYPNPTSGLTSIDFTLNQTGNVQFALSNVIGQKVDVKDFGKLNEGNHQINFDVSKLETGIYFYTVTLNDTKFTKKLIVK